MTGSRDKEGSIRRQASFSSFKGRSNRSPTHAIRNFCSPGEASPRFPGLSNPPSKAFSSYSSSTAQFSRSRFCDERFWPCFRPVHRSSQQELVTIADLMKMWADPGTGGSEGTCRWGFWSSRHGRLWFKAGCLWEIRQGYCICPWVSFELLLDLK